MKEFNELFIPDDRLYSNDHEWACYEGNYIKIGISHYAQEQLGDIVYVELPAVGDKFDKNQEFGVVESLKSVSDLLIPVSGEVVAVNPNLKNNSNLVNESPYEKGWMINVKLDSITEMDTLMKADEYRAMLKKE